MANLGLQEMGLLFCYEKTIQNLCEQGDGKLLKTRKEDGHAIEPQLNRGRICRIGRENQTEFVLMQLYGSEGKESARSSRLRKATGSGLHI